MSYVYPDVAITNMSGGRADTGTAQDIASNQSACELNITYNSFGSVGGRDWGLTRVGDDSSAQGPTQTLGSVCACNSCNFNEPTADPQSSGVRLLFKAAADNITCRTDLDFLDNNSQTWTNFDNIEGIHSFEWITKNCRVYYSNGIEDLRFSCFASDDDCGITHQSSYPTCRTEYGVGVQVPTVISAEDVGGQTVGFIVFGRPLFDCTDQWNKLCKYIRTHPPFKVDGDCNELVPQEDNPDKASICLKVTRGPNSCNTEYDCHGNVTTGGGDTVEYKIETVDVLSCCDRTIIWYNPPGKFPPVGTYYDVCVSWNDGNSGDPCTNATDSYCPTQCCGGADQRVAEGVRGYILTEFQSRLFISGDIRDKEIDKVAYGSKAFELSVDQGLPFNVGDFIDRGSYRTSADPGEIAFRKDCGHITDLNEVNGSLVLSRYASTPQQYSVILNAPTDGAAFFEAQQEQNSNAPNWHLSSVVTNGLQYYISNYSGLNEYVAYGLFNGFIAKSSKLKSNQIKRTMERVDFSHAAMVYWDGKIFTAGRMKDPCILTPVDYCNVVAESKTENDVVLVFNLSTESFGLWSNWYVNRWHITPEGQLFTGDSRNGNVYRVDKQLVDYRVDDQAPDIGTNPAEEIGQDFPTYWESAQLNFKQPIKGKVIDALIVRGYLGPGNPLTIGVRLDCKNTYQKKIEYKQIEGCLTPSPELCGSMDCQLCEGDNNSKFFQVKIPFNDSGQTFMSMSTFFARFGSNWRITGWFPLIRQITDSQANDIADCTSNVSGISCFEAC